MYSSNFYLPPPFFRKKQQYVSRAQIYNRYNNESEKNRIRPESHTTFEFEPEFKNKNVNMNACSTLHEEKEEALFEIFGLKIYFDDLLLVCIIFFLYQEGIQDEYLFLALILLLLN